MLEQDKALKPPPVYDPLSLNWLPRTEMWLPIPMDRIEGVYKENGLLVIHLVERTRKSPVPIIPSDTVDRPREAGVEALVLPAYDLPEDQVAQLAVKRYARLGIHPVGNEGGTVVRQVPIVAARAEKPYNLQVVADMAAAVEQYAALEADVEFTTTERLVLQTPPKIVCDLQCPDHYVLYGVVKVVAVEAE
jgi:hypothetical protein